MLSRLIEELDRRILDDATLTQPLFEQLVAAQRELGLLFGDRPTCPFLRPHIIARSQYDAVVQAASVIAKAVEKLVNQALRDEHLLSLFGLTDRESRMARIDPGYARLCVSSRLDACISDFAFQFLEYNAETPAGVGDQMQLEKALFGFNHLKQLLADHRHWRPSPHQRLLQSLMSIYREWGGEEDQPHIAIVDWRGVATESEFRVLQKYFSDEGYATVIADPRDLSYSEAGLFAGDFRIDIIYKRVIIHEFLERCEDDHPLVRAYMDRRVCMINSFRSKIAHKKATFAILSDPQFAGRFTRAENEVIGRHVPWTRRVEETKTSFEGGEVELVDLVRREQSRFVLKPNDDYGGHGVFIGWETSSQEWEHAISIALDHPYVVQERVAMKKTVIPTFGESVRMEELFVDFNPFLFENEPEGALIRLSSSSLLNITSGGGQTALLVMEGM
jgi:glutathionylspermidine synthase